MANSAGIILPGQTAANTTTPAAGAATIYQDSGSGSPKFKDSSGNTHALGGLTGWIDVTTAGILTTNTGAQNSTALTALVGASGTAANGSVIFFPAGVYQFNGAVTVGAKSYIFQGVGANRAGSPATAYTELQVITSVVGFLTLTSGNWYTQFRDMTFTAATNQTSGACVTTGNNVGINFFNVSIQSNGGTWFNGIDFTGGNGGNQCYISFCVFSGFTNHGAIINGAGSSPVFLSTNFQGQWGTTAQTALSCMNIQLAGAVQLDDCDLIGANNNMLVNPIVATVVASIQCTNTYFDFASGSCLKITGAGATVRCQFMTCTFTTSVQSTGYSAVEISTTVAAGTQGITFIGCNVLNTFGTTGTTNGFLLTGAADFSIIGCRIAGWTNGINLTPHTTAAATIAQIANNVIGTSGGYGVNSVGILLNAGAATYGALEIQNNDCSGNTTALTNNLTTNIPATASRYRITDNAGINPRTITSPAVPATGVTATNTTGGRVTAYVKFTVLPTVVTVNGVSTVLPIAAQLATYQLDPGGTIAITDGTMPTWTWVGN